MEHKAELLSAEVLQWKFYFFTSENKFTDSKIISGS